LGNIIYWGIIRTFVVILALWLLQDYIEYKYWWVVLSMGAYGVILHPALIQYRLFQEKNKKIIETTLCSTCKYFDKTAILCLKHDEHPTQEYLPCDGIDWTPQEFKGYYEEENI